MKGLSENKTYFGVCNKKVNSVKILEIFYLCLVQDTSFDCVQYKISPHKILFKFSSLKEEIKRSCKG